MIRANSNYVRYTMTARSQGARRDAVHARDRGRPDQGGRVVRGRLVRGRASHVHRHRRRCHDDRLVPGPDLPDLLHGLPRRVQREPAEVPGKKLSLKAADGGEPQARARQPKRSRVSRFEDAFAGDVDDPKPDAGHAGAEDRGEAVDAKPADRCRRAEGRARTKPKAKADARSSSPLAPRPRFGMGRTWRRAARPRPP